MALALTANVLQDDLAVSLARVIAVANKRARELGVDALQSMLTITQIFDDDFYWRVNYGPKDYIGRHGGDLIVEVDTNNATIKQVLYGQ